MVNTPLSMYSEMMAIYSALASLGPARSARSLRKPCYEVPGRGGRRVTATRPRSVRRGCLRPG